MHQKLQDAAILPKRSGDAAMTATGVKVFQAVSLFVAVAAGVVAICASFRYADFVDTPFDLPIFPALFLAYDRLPLLIIVLATGLLLCVPVRAITPALAPTRILNRLARRPLVLPGIAVVLLCLGSVFVYHNHPLSADEFAAVFQAKVFASGHIFGKFPVPLVSRLMFPGFVNYFFVVSPSSGAIASNYWPGFALLLTPFTAAHISWACNPLIGGFSLWLMYRIVVEVSQDRSAGIWATLLAVASPAFVVNAISYYSMPVHLCLNLLFAYLLIRGGWKSTVMAGVVGSLALALHNPVPHIAFATPWVVWSLWRKGGLRNTLILALAYLPLAVPLVVGWEAVRALVPSDQLPAATDPGSIAGHAAPSTAPAALPEPSPGMVAKLSSVIRSLLSPFKVPSLELLGSRTIELAKLVAWNVPSLLALAGFGAWRFRKDRRVLAFVASAVVTLGVYLLYSADQGHGWGDRYFHSAWGVLPVLAALALSRHDEEEVAPALSSTALLFVLLSLMVLVPWRLSQVYSFMERDLAQVPPHDPSTPSVIFINPEGGYYAQDLIQNDPFLRDPVVYMFSNGIQSDATLVRAAFPGFVGRLYDGGSVWTAREAPLEARPRRAPAD